MSNLPEIEIYFHVCIESSNSITGKRISPKFSTEAEARQFIKTHNLNTARIRRSAFL